MKVRVARASSKNEEKTVNMWWAGQFADELLKLNEEVPLTEDTKEDSWEDDNDEEYTYVVSVNKKTRAVEIMIYDYYIE